MRVAPITLVTDALMSDNIETDSQQLNQAFGYSVQCSIGGSGTVAGTLKLQGSLDESTYVDIDGTSETLSTDSPVLYNVSDAMYPYVRVVFTDAGSDVARTMTIKIFYRGF